MLQTIIRYLLVATLAAVLVFLALAPASRAESASIEKCKNETSAQCLTDLGVKLAMNARSLPKGMREVGMLAQLGRFEDALALELRIAKGKEQPPENIEATANRRLASHRIAAAIREGESLQVAIDKTPYVDPGILWISALDLLGRNPYGVSIGPEYTPDERYFGIVSDIANHIAKMAESEPERPRISHVVYAAELQAALRNRDDALHLLEALPRTEEPGINFSDDLMRLVGTQTALRLYRDAGGKRTNMLLTAASAESDLGRAADYLERAFSEFASEKPWADFSLMARTVEGAAVLGLEDLAIRLARELSDRAKTEPSAYPVFPHIDATRALMASGADEAEVRASLARAEGFFPRNENEVVGIGIASGAIVWGSSGLEAQARREIANLKARLGEVQAAIQIMDGIANPAFAWSDMLTSDIPLTHLQALLDAASDVLSEEEHAYVRALHAQELLFFDGSEGQRNWAQATATDLLQRERLDGNRSAVIYSILTRIGAKLGNQGIQRLALTKMAEAALVSRDFSDLIAAGFQWHQSDHSP